MKYLFALAATCILLISSCKKEEMEPCPSPPIETIPNYIPLAIGNYWVYNNYRVDTLGNETKLNIVDSLYINRDTLINDNKYFVLEGTYTLFTPKSGIIFILRDSSNYLVDEKGEIMFSSVNFSDTLYIEAALSSPSDTFAMKYKRMDSLMYSISVPAGDFETLDYRTTILVPFNHPQQKTKLYHNYYADGVGMVLETWGALAATDIIERRLVSYQVITAIE